MNIELFKSCVKTIQVNLGREYAKDGINKVWQAVKDDPDQAMMNAGDWVLLNYVSLPPPAKIMEAIKAEAKKIKLEESRNRESVWEAQKEKRSEGPMLAANVRDLHSDMAHMCMKLMSSKEPRETKLDAFRHMEQKFPGVGWLEEGVKLDKYYREHP